MEIFQVGGSVRDELMGVQPKDRDWVVVNSSPEEMEKDGFKPIEKISQYFCILKQTKNMLLQEQKKNLVLDTKALNFTLTQVLLLRKILSEGTLQLIQLPKIRTEILLIHSMGN